MWNANALASLLLLTAHVQAQAKKVTPPPAWVTEAEFNRVLKKLPDQARSADYAKDKKSDYLELRDEAIVLAKNMNRTEDEFKTKKQLDCTTFASPVLHLLVKKTWEGFQQKSVNGLGEDVAKHYGLSESHRLVTAEEREHLNDRAWRKQNEGVYYFDLYDREKRKNDDGHVGFVVITNAGIRQIHFTSTKGQNGGLLDDDKFRDYVAAQLKRPRPNLVIVLYRLKS